MPDQQVSSLPEATDFDMEDMFAIEQDSIAKKLYGQTLLSRLRIEMGAHGGVKDISSSKTGVTTTITMTFTDDTTFSFTINDGSNLYYLDIQGGDPGHISTVSRDYLTPESAAPFGTGVTNFAITRGGRFCAITDAPSQSRYIRCEVLHVITSESGVYIGTSQPTSEAIKVWIKTNGTGNNILQIKNDQGDWVGITAIKGDPGQQGPQGPEGPQGATGNSGVYIGSVAPTDPDVNVWIDPNGSGVGILRIKDISGNWTGIESIEGTPGEDGVDGKDGENGKDGEDGYSPTVSTSPISGGHRVTIRDKSGAHQFDVMDGDGDAVLISVNAGENLYQQIMEAYNSGKMPVLLYTDRLPEDQIYMRKRYFYVESWTFFHGSEPMYFACVHENTVEIATVSYNSPFTIVGSYPLLILDASDIPSSPSQDHYPSSYAVANALSEKIGKAVYTATITSASWSQQPGSQSNWWVASGISVSGLKSTDDFVLDLQPATIYSSSLEDIQNAFGEIYSVDNPSDGSFNAYLLGDKPSVDIPVRLLVLR